MLHSAKLLFAAALLLLAAATASAQAPPKFKERYQEYLACNSGSCLEWYKGTFQLSWQSARQIDGTFGIVKADTIFRCALGDFLLEVPIGNDPNYQPGDTKATIHFIQPLLNQYRYMTLKLNWSNNILRVRLKGKLPDATSPLARTRAETINPSDLADAEIQLINSGNSFFFQYYTNYHYPFKTQVKMKEVDGTTYELKKVTVTGANEPSVP